VEVAKFCGSGISATYPRKPSTSGFKGATGARFPVTICSLLGV
jgi:hypothetical protein